MPETFEQVSTALINLKNAILNSTADNRTMTEMWGWNFPPLSRHDFAGMIEQLLNKIDKIKDFEIDQETRKDLERIPILVSIFQTQTIPYLFNGHGAQSTPTFIALINGIDAIISPLLTWEILQDNKALPSSIAKRLRSIQAGIEEIVPDKADLERKIQTINDATAAAENLPVDLRSLQFAKEKTEKVAKEAEEFSVKISVHMKDADETIKLLYDKQQSAERLVESCEKAYHITTTKGLAAAFDQRAQRLSVSMTLWVGGLLLALLYGGSVGSKRVEALSILLSKDNLDWGVAVIEIFLSVLALGGPIWFAWISTKQISQRFKLSEDYAFKASVAKAYEGYRKEAARIDPDFESRLFSSALTRLEEAPLRLVEENTYGSPWHEFFESEQFKRACETIPGFGDKVLDIFKKGIDLSKCIKGKSLLDA